MDKLRQLFQFHPVVIGDGSFGTFLESQGLSGLPETHNIKSPEKIQQVHESYLLSGSMIITTNSFNGNSIRLKQHGLINSLIEINSKAVILAKKAIEASGVDALVAGSIGPTGHILDPYGELSHRDAFLSFFLQARVLFKNGVDFFLIETMSDLEEVKIVIEAVRRICNLPIAVTMSFSQNLHTIMGISPQKALETLSSLGIEMIGANCGNGLQETEQIMRLMSLVKKKGVILISQPNMGIPKINDEGKTEFEIDENEIVAYVKEMRKLGVRYFGGCCGSTPSEISLIKRTLNT